MAMINREWWYMRIYGARINLNCYWLPLGVSER